MLISILLLSTNVYADQATVIVNTTSPVICFSEEDAKKIVVQLEDLADYKDQVEILKQQNQELLKQIELLKTINKLQQDQIVLSTQAITNLNEVIKSQKNAYEKKIEEEKPSILNKLYTTVGTLGVGVLIGILLI